MEYYDFPESDKVSTYNSMEAIIFRINNLWDLFNRRVLRGKLIEANWILDRLWGELVADAKKEHEQIFESMNEEYSKIDKFRDKDKLYLFLMRKEKFLRLLQDSQGKGVKHQESALDYMDG